MTCYSINRGVFKRSNIILHQLFDFGLKSPNTGSCMDCLHEFYLKLAQTVLGRIQTCQWFDLGIFKDK